MLQCLKNRQIENTKSASAKLTKTASFGRISAPDIVIFGGNVSWVGNIWFLSPLIPSKQEQNIQTETTWFASVCIFFEESVFTFQFWNDKIHNYVKKIHLALSSLQN